MNNANTLPAGTVLKSQSVQYELKQVVSVSAAGVKYLASAISSGSTSSQMRVNVMQYTGGNTELLSAAWQLKNIAATTDNIISFREVFESDGNVFAVCDIIEGETLRCYVAARGRLSEQQTLAVMRPVVEAVATTHQASVAHLNIKPENIIMTRSAEGAEVPVLIDFALQSRPALGQTPDGFIAMEQYAGLNGYSPASDVYSLAATMFYCLSGMALLPGMQLTGVQLSQVVPDVTPHLKGILLSALSIHVADRPANAAVLAGMLNGVVNVGQSVGVPRQMPPVIPMIPPIVPTGATPPVHSVGQTIPTTPIPPIPPIPTVKQQPATSQTMGSQAYYDAREKKSGSGRVWLFIILGVLITAIIGLGIYGYFAFVKDSTDGWTKIEEIVDEVCADSETQSEQEITTDTYAESPAPAPQIESTLKGCYDHAFHQLKPGSGVKSLTWHGLTFYFNRDGEWTNEYYEDALKDREWDFENGKRITEYYTQDGVSGSMSYEWDGFLISTITDYNRNFKVTRCYNSNGTLLSAMTEYFNDKPSRSFDYSDYVFDGHDNWISRKVGSKTERRTITYYN